MEHAQFVFGTSTEKKTRPFTSEKYTAYLARIHTLDPLTELVNQLLIAPTLAAFEEKVIASLPRGQEQE